MALDPSPSSAPLPTNLHGFNPEELLARGMHSARVSIAGTIGWTPPTVEEIARILTHYEIIAFLGRGGMGAVYQGRHATLDRIVAIKLLPLEISVQRDFADRFIREARAMARLEHPNIITVYDFGQTTEGHFYYVMEFINGKTLHEMIRGGGVAPHEAMAMVEQVCDALAYAHLHGVVHRDIKPANVMVDRLGRVKVADFGLARLTDKAPGEYGNTMTGEVLGTPDYMAPEQKRGAHVDHRADVYSVGVLLYEALAGEVPQGVFDPISKRTGLDKRIDPIIARAMAQQPDKRFQSTIEIRAALSAVRPSVAKAAQKAKPSTRGRTPAGPAPLPSAHLAPELPAQHSLQKTMLWVGGGCVLVALALGAWLLTADARSAKHAESSPASVAAMPTAALPAQAAPEVAPAAASEPEPPVPAAPPRKHRPTSDEPWQEVIGAPARKLVGGATEEGGVLTLPKAAKLELAEPLGEGAIAVEWTYHAAVNHLRVCTQGQGSNGTYSAVIVSPGLVSMEYQHGETVESVMRFPLARPLQEGEDCELELRWSGPRLTAKLDGETLGEILVPAHPKRLVSVENASETTATVDSVKMLDLQKSQPVAAGR